MKHLFEIDEMARGRKASPVVAAVWPEDDSSLNALAIAMEKGIANVIAVGCHEQILARLAGRPGAERLKAVEAATPSEAASVAVAFVRQGKAQLIMKGLVNTDVLLKAVLNKECGLMEPGGVLTHVTIGEIPVHHKLLLFGDVAVLPCPNAEQREAQLRLMLRMARRMGIDRPRVAMVHCSEKVDERHFPVTAHYRDLVGRAATGEFGDCIVDGPLDIKTVLNAHAAAVKGINSPLQGDADVLIFPEIESGNVFYKAMTLFADMKTAALVCGARVPLVVPSRGDDSDTKFHSLAAATILL